MFLSYFTVSFPLAQRGCFLLSQILYCSITDLDGFYDHMRDIPWEDNFGGYFLLLASCYSLYPSYIPVTVLLF